MASNIRVTLEVDGRQYLEDLKRAESATKSFASTTQANLDAGATGFTRVSATVQILQQKLMGLKAALVGLGFGALSRSALEFASTIKDLSDSSGVAVRDLTALSNALVTSGVAAEKLPDIIGRFSNNVDEAASSAGRSLHTFEQLGISLQDIGQKDTTDLLIAALEGLVAMGPGVERTAKQMELFGRSGRTMDPEGLLNSFRALRASTDRYSDAIRAAAELSDQLGLAQQRLSIAFTAAFQGPISALSNFITQMNQSERALEGTITVIQGLGVALAAVVGGSALLGLVRIASYIATAFAAAGTALTSFGAAAGGAMGAIARFTAVGRAFSILAAAGFGLYAASQIFENFADVATNALARTIEAIGEFAASLLNLPTEGLAAALRQIPEAIRPEWMNSVIQFFGENGIGTPLQALVNRARAAREEFEQITQAAREASQIAQPQQPTEPGTAQPGQPQGPSTRGAEAEIARRTAEIVKQTRNFQDQNNTIIQRIQLEQALIGESRDFVEILRTQQELGERFSDQIKELEDRKAQLSEQDQRYIPIIDAQIQAIRQLRAEQDQQITTALQARQAAEAGLRIQEQTARGSAQLEELRAQLYGYSLSALERFNQAQAQGDFRDKTQAEVELLRQQAAQYDGLNARIRSVITTRETEQQLLDLQTQLLGRQFSAQEKLEQLRLQNPEQFARRTQAENDALQRQAELIDQTTQRLRAQAFARDLTRQGEDFATNIREQMRMDTTFSESRRRSLQVEIDLNRQLQQAVREISDRYGDETQLSEERKRARQSEIDNAVQGFTRLREEQQKLVEADQRQRETFSFGWDQALGRYVAQAKDSAQEAKTYFDTFTRGMEDAIVKFVQTGKFNFKDLANSMIAEFTRMQARKLMAGIFEIGSGLFGATEIAGRAIGGPVSSNTPYVVGERGPELFVPRTAGSIIPNNQFSTASVPVSNNVVYNIQAVDALSFRQMVARDPEFLYAVTERGRSSLPNRR